MGVPAFFRWLSRKYPSVIIDCIENRPPEVDGVRPPVDCTQPNPNEIEFDNLYLDMNGIIHPCTHPEDKPAPKDEDEMMLAIFECIDRLFAIVRPRKLLYMAIDGVAPRAKMNQQRSRRFRASKESQEKILTMERMREEIEASGAWLPAPKEKGSHFDSNCITPGTPFMDRLSLCLQFYIYERISSDVAWKDIKVILSDANVPGEGEHKIMDYIRRQRAQPDHDPNTQHVLCGADADLIMLGLATHEPNFTIIREEFKPNRPKPCDLCRQMGHEIHECTGAPKPLDVHDQYVGDDNTDFGAETKYIFVRLSVLREYLRRELEMPNLPFEYDFERAIDDWVFMCFFVGNDFLPHLPSLEIRENAIDRLVKLYKNAVYQTGGFLTESGLVKPERVELIMQPLGEMEDSIFKQRQQRELQFKEREKAKRRREGIESYNAPRFITHGQFEPVALGRGRGGVNPVRGAKREAYDMRREGLSNKNAAMELKSMLRGRHGDSAAGSSSGEQQHQQQRGQKRHHEGDDDEPLDEVRLYEDGFKDRYYESKFGVKPDEVDFRYKVAREYTIGLCWVLRYYYQGCPSWKWYFPYHYAPFASDFVGIGKVANEFERDTKPFEPLEQLMGVFPAGSRSHVPQPWGELMLDPNCNIIDFYPEDFKIDLNGKKYAWQGVALLPFVDEKRLKKALKPLYSSLTEDERRRNQRGDDRLYVGSNHKGANLLKSIYTDNFEEQQEVQLLGQLFGGMRGRVLFSTDYVKFQQPMESPVRGMKALEESSARSVVSVRFRDPDYGPEHVFSSKRLKGAVDPPEVLKDQNAHYQGGYRPRFGFGDRRNEASIGAAGHRMLNRQVGRGKFSNVPPPVHAEFVSQEQFQRPPPSFRGRGNFRPRFDHHSRGNHSNNSSGQQGGYNRGHQGRFDGHGHRMSGPHRGRGNQGHRNQQQQQQQQQQGQYGYYTANFRGSRRYY